MNHGPRIPDQQDWLLFAACILFASIVIWLVT